jgi:hypothetical protein
MSGIHQRSRELDRLPLGAATPTTNINFDAVDMTVTGCWWGWAGSIWAWLVFSTGYPIKRRFYSGVPRDVKKRQDTRPYRP